MVYNDGQPGWDAVRLATGNLLPLDYPDTAIAGKIKSAYSKIQLSVKRLLDAPFEATDVEYDHSVQLEITIAAMYCLKAYGPEFLDKIRELKEEAKDDLLILTEGTIAAEEVTDVEDINENTDPKSWNLNTDIPVPNRLTIKHGTGSMTIESQFN
jgi:hypothetical protein